MSLIRTNEPLADHLARPIDTAFLAELWHRYPEVALEIADKSRAEYEMTIGMQDLSDRKVRT